MAEEGLSLPEVNHVRNRSSDLLHAKNPSETSNYRSRALLSPIEASTIKKAISPSQMEFSNSQRYKD